MMPFFVHQVINNAPPSYQFFVGYKKKVWNGQTKYFVGSIYSPLKTRRKREILLKLQKKNQA
jgi:hypothetical protein